MLDFIKQKRSSKLLLLAMMLLAKVAPATSASKLYIDDFSIEPGQTRQVALNFDTNMPDVYMVSVRILLPDGLDFSKLDNGKWASVNSERAAGSTVELNHTSSSNYYGRVLVFNTVKTPISGSTGALVYFNVHAADTMTVDKLIELTEVSVRRTNGEVDEATCKGCKVSLLSKDDEGRDQLLALASQLEQKLSNVKNQILTECADVKDMFNERILLLEQRIAALKTAINDAYDNYSLDRTALTAQVNELSAEIDKVLADALAAQKAYDEGIELQEQEKRLKFVNDSVFAVLTVQLDAVQAQLDSAKTVIASECKDVASQFDERLVALQQQIEALRADLQQKHDAIALTVDSRLDTSAIEEAIAQVIADAKKAQQAYDAEQEWLKRVAVNDSVFAVLNAQIDAVQAQLDAAKSVISSDCKDVASQFDERLATLQQQIEALRTDLQLKHEAVTLTADSQVETSAIEAAISQVVADAKNAQQAFEEEQERLEHERQLKAVNDSVFAVLSTQLDAVQQQLDEARNTIASDCKDVASQFDERLTAIQGQIDALRAELKHSYDSIALTAESQLDTSSIEASIAQLLADAQNAQRTYDEEQERLEHERQLKVVNDSVFAVLSAQLDAVQQQLDAARTTIAADCKDVASQFDERLNALQGQIDALRAELKKSYDSIALTADSKLDTSSIEAGIAQLLVDAQNAQRAYDEEQERLEHERQLKAVNDSVFAVLSAQLDAVQQQLDAARNTIAADCKDVASQFDERLNALQDQIDALRAELKKSFDSIALTAESQLDTSSIEAGIAQLLADAQDAQRAYDEEQERLEHERQLKAVNDSVFAVLSAQLDAVQQKLDAVRDKIAADCKDVASQFDERLNALQDQIDELRAELNKSHDSIALTADSQIDTSALETAIFQLLNDAMDAQHIYDDEQQRLEYERLKALNDSVYAVLNAQLEAMQAELDAVKVILKEECPLVANDFAGVVDGLQQYISNCRETLSQQYEALQLTADTRIDKETFEETIAKLLVDARAAQEVKASVAPVLSLNGAVAYYDQHGHRVSGLLRGQVTIVKMQDGTTRKVLMK